MASCWMNGREGDHQHQAVEHQRHQADEPHCQTNHPVAQEVLARLKGSFRNKQVGGFKINTLYVNFWIISKLFGKHTEY